MKKLILVYGLIVGAVIILMFLLHFTGSEIINNNGELIGYGTMIIAFSSIFFAIKSHRDKSNNGIISFWNAFKIGLGITLVASAFYVISWMIISETIAKDYAAEYFQKAVESIQTSTELSQTEITAQVNELEEFKEMYKNPLIKIGMTFMEIFPVGFIISLIAALILRRK